MIYYTQRRLFYITVYYCMNHTGTYDAFRLDIFTPPQKGRFVLIQAAKKVGEWKYLFITSALDGGEWSTSCPARITPGKTAPATAI